jgi:hypothetical protein
MRIYWLDKPAAKESAFKYQDFCFQLREMAINSFLDKEVALAGSGSG